MPYYNTTNVYGTVRDCSSKTPYYTNDYFRNYTRSQPCYQQPYKTTYVSSPTVPIFRKPCFSMSNGGNGSVVVESSASLSSNCSKQSVSSTSSSSSSSSSTGCHSRTGSNDGKINILVTNKTNAKPAYQAIVAACNSPATSSFSQISNVVHSRDCTPNGFITTTTTTSPVVVSTTTSRAKSPLLNCSTSTSARAKSPLLNCSTSTITRAKSPLLNCSSSTSISTSSQATSLNNRQSRRCDDTYDDCNSTSMFTIIKRDNANTSRSRSPSASSISSCCRHSQPLSAPTLTANPPCSTDKIIYGRVRSDSASRSPHRSPHRSSSSVTQTNNAPCNNGGNELVATAISDIQLNNTDDLTTQVDYVLKDADNRMICRGKVVEIECSDLAAKTGLISKCLYINDLLTKAGLSELNLDSDPTFTHHGKAILIFSNHKDAEAFGNYHNTKFQVVFTNAAEIDKSVVPKPMKKNVSFNDSVEEEYDDNDYSYSSNTGSMSKGKSILKSRSCTNVHASSTTATGTLDPITSRSSFGYNGHSTSTNDLTSAGKCADNLLISANSSKKGNKPEGYEILTIRAKLKQRVGSNRAQQVTLSDIDSIMRNVVTIIQNEFMKRFPSSPPQAAITAN